jgi:hypothetical protein
MSFVAKKFAVLSTKSYLVGVRAMRFNPPMRRMMKPVVRVVVTVRVIFTGDQEFTV